MKHRTTFAAFAAAALFVFAPACGGKKAPPAADFPALGAPAKLTMLDAGGSAAKVPLRWKAEKGASEKLAMVLDTKMEIKAAGQTMPMNMAMRMDMDGEVVDVLADGSSVIRMVVQDASMDMPGLEGSGDMVKDMLRGMTIESTLDPRGVTTDTKVSGGGALMEQLGDQMDSSLDQLALPFPEEPVGVGSKWQALSTQETNNMQVRMVVTYELVELDGDKGKVKLSLQQYADKQKMDVGGATADLDSLESDGSGTMEFDLTRPLFAKADLTLKMTAEMSVMGQDADMKVDAKVSMSPRGE